MALDGSISWNEVINVVFPIVGVVIAAYGWGNRQLGEMRKEFASFREEVAKEYVSNSTLEKFEQRLLAAVEKLGDRLDNIITARKE